ncbi:Ig-like domain-containing protein, partial [Hymenobacter sp. UV11]
MPSQLFSPPPRPRCRPWRALLALALLLPLAAAAQAPTVVRGSLNPAANAESAPSGTPVVVPFSQNINPGTAGTIRVFSQQYRGRRTATAST